MFARFVHNLVILLALAAGLLLSSAAPAIQAQEGGPIWLPLVGTGENTGQDTLDTTIDLAIVPPEMHDAILMVVSNKPSTVLVGERFAVVSLRQEQDWALATLAVTDSQIDGIGMGDNGGLIVLQKINNDTWEAGLEGTPDFHRIVEEIGDDSIGPSFAEVFQLREATLGSEQALKFPWSRDRNPIDSVDHNWILMQNWHDDLGNPGGLNLDFAPAHALKWKWVLAAHHGWVTRICEIGTYSANIQVRTVEGTITEILAFRQGYTC